MRSAAIVAVVLCLAGLAPLAAGAGQAEPPPADRASEAPSTVPDLDRIEAEHGIRVDLVQLASAGYMIDFRYWVTDADKAWALFRDSKRRELVHSASGARLIVPAPAYIGPMSQTSEKPKEGRRYYVFFANPGQLVSSGDTVTIIIGDVEIGPLQVR